jgi:site-specific recombinase XerD
MNSTMPRRVRDALERTRGYLPAWRAFEAWCVERHVVALGAAPATLHAYLQHRIAEGAAASTLESVRGAIFRAHDGAAIDRPDSEEVRALLNMRRRRERAPPIDREQLRALVRACGTDPRGLRDRALFLAIHHARLWAVRAVALNVDEIRTRSDLAPLRERDPDPELCPVVALDQWLEARGRPERGALFVAVHPRERRFFGRQLWPCDVHNALLRRSAGLPFRLTARRLRRADGAGA